MIRMMYDIVVPTTYGTCRVDKNAEGLYDTNHAFHCNYVEIIYTVDHILFRDPIKNSIIFIFFKLLKRIQLAVR